MTTNLVDCVDLVLKGIKNLPIIALVKSTYFQLAGLFVWKGVQAQVRLH